MRIQVALQLQAQQPGLSWHDAQVKITANLPTYSAAVAQGQTPDQIASGLLSIVVVPTGGV